MRSNSCSTAGRTIAHVTVADTPHTRYTVVERVVATTEFRTACYPGTRKDDIGGRFPGSRFSGSTSLPKAFRFSGLSAQSLAVHSCGDSRSIDCVPF